MRNNLAAMAALTAMAMSSEPHGATLEVERRARRSGPPDGGWRDHNSVSLAEVVYRSRQRRRAKQTHPGKRGRP